MSFEAFAITSFKVWSAIAMLVRGGDAIVVGQSSSPCLVATPKNQEGSLCAVPSSHNALWLKYNVFNYRLYKPKIHLPSYLW
jgi:hypothetical protein